MAQIRKKGKKYLAIVRRKGQPQVSKTFTRKRDAERWAIDIEAEMQRGAFTDRRAGDTRTLRSILEKYSEEVSPRKKGWRAEQSKLSVLGQAPFAAKGIALVKPEEIGEWRDARLTAGRARNTVRNDMVVLSTVYQHAMLEWRLVQHNPVRAIRWPSPGKARERRLRDDEEAALLANANPRERALIVTLLETGMRLGELLGITYPGSLDLTDRVIDLGDTKNGEARLVPLTKAAVAALKTAPVNLHTRKLFPWRSDGWSHRFERICERAEIEGLTTHDLRHEAVSRLFERGFNVMEVSAISGHKTLAMLRRYTHLRPKDLLARLDATA